MALAAAKSTRGIGEAKQEESRAAVTALVWCVLAALSNCRSLISGPLHQLLPGPAASYALWPVSHNVRTCARIFIADFDENPARIPGPGQCEGARELSAMQDERQMPGLVTQDLGGPSSQRITAPVPRMCVPPTPSKSPADIGWSSTGTASRRILGSSEGPLGTARERSTSPDCRRKSKCSLVAS